MAIINDKDWLLIMISAIASSVLAKYLAFNNFHWTNIAIIDDISGALILGLIIFAILWIFFTVIDKIFNISEKDNNPNLRYIVLTPEIKKVLSDYQVSLRSPNGFSR